MDVAKELAGRTFEQFQQEMIAFAKDYQGENYAGDAYYMEDEGWREHFDDGDAPDATVLADMEYWEE